MTFTLASHPNILIYYKLRSTPWSRIKCTYKRAFSVANGTITFVLATPRYFYGSDREGDGPPRIKREYIYDGWEPRDEMQAIKVAQSAHTWFILTARWRVIAAVDLVGHFSDATVDTLNRQERLILTLTCEHAREICIRLNRAHMPVGNFINNPVMWLA